MKKQGQGCDCGTGCDCKPKRSLFDGGMLFLGGFLSAVVLIVATSNIANEKSLSANIGADFYSEANTVDEKPWDENPWRGGISEVGVPKGYHVDEKPWDENPWQGDKYGAPDQRKCSPVGVIVDGEYQETTCPEEELQKEVEEFGNLDDVDQLEKTIDEFDVAEAEYLEKLRNTDPNSYDYWEIRNKIAELKAKKNEIRHKKRALQEQMKEKKLQKIEQKVTESPGSDQKAVLEKCRQLGKEDFAACLKEHMGKKEQRTEFGDTSAFESRVQKEPMMRPNSVGNMAPQNVRPTITIKDIVKKCIEENPAILKECIRNGVLDIKEQILREARQKTQQIEAEYSSYESETSNSMSELEQVGLPPPPQRFIVPSPTPYSNDMPQTEAEWRDYNQQFNAKPTI